MNGKKDKAQKIMDQIGVKLKGEEKDKEGKQLLKVNAIKETCGFQLCIGCVMIMVYLLRSAVVLSFI